MAAPELDQVALSLVGLELCRFLELDRAQFQPHLPLEAQKFDKLDLVRGKRAGEADLFSVPLKHVDQ